MTGGSWLRSPAERDPQQRPHTRRKRMRKKRVAFQHAGIAVRCALARPLPVNQRHRDSALGEMQGKRGADDPSAEHDYVAACHSNLMGEDSWNGATLI